MGSKRESEVPMPIENVRLVVPYEMTQVVRVPNEETGMVEDKPVKVIKDVVVEEVKMVRHTTGIDPYTGTNYGSAEIPKENQYDPATGLPIFHRYIAGTQHSIEWPWERAEDIEDSGVTAEDAETKSDKASLTRRTLNFVTSPIVSAKRLLLRRPKTAAAKQEERPPLAPQLEEARQEAIRATERKPKSKDPGHAEAHDNVDTTRNIVEGAESMAYTLMYPPLPEELASELRGDMTALRREQRKDKDAPRLGPKMKNRTEQGGVAAEIARAKYVAAQRMKTPMQVRWETEHARKVKAKKANPLVSTDELMEALGRHMVQQRRVKKVKVGEAD